MAEKAAANESQFYFYCGDLDKDTFEVADFLGNESISCPYQFDITLISREIDISPDNIIGHPASLYILRKNSYIPYSGVINEFQFIDKNVDYCIYKARLVPRIWLASLNHQTRIFQNITLDKIISTLLEESNVKNIDIKIQNNPEYEYIVQYQESDLNFITRLMEESGIWYFFTEAPKSKSEIENAKKGQISEELVRIVDAAQEFEDIANDKKVLFRSLSGMYERSDGEVYESINNIQYEKCVIPKDVFVRNYNYRKPEDDLTGRKIIPGGFKGTVYEYGGKSKTSPEADIAAQILVKRIQAQQIKLSGSGDCRAFKVGYRFELVDHFRKDVCQPYVIFGVSHSGGNFTGGKDSLTYKNQFVAIPIELANKYAPEKKAIFTKVNGIISAHVEANNSEYATIDDKGRYKVRFPFDLVGKKNDCTGSKYVRLAQPYSGAQYGIHFPLHQGAEMVLACIDGDPSKPMGIGTVPNANSISPVVESNKQQNIIRTAGGNELLMDDTDGKQKVHLISKAKNIVKLDDENKNVLISSTDKNQIIIDDKNSIVNIISNKHSISLCYSSDNFILITTEKANIIKLDDKNERISIQTPGGHKFDLDDKEKKIIIEDGQGKNNLTLDGNSGCIISSTGKIEIKAQQDLVIDAANIVIKANGKLEASAAMDFKIKGMNLEAKGDVGVKINAGATVEMKGGASTKVEGTMVDVSGSGMTKIKGGIVMIN